MRAAALPGSLSWEVSGERPRNLWLNGWEDLISRKKGTGQARLQPNPGKGFKASGDALGKALGVQLRPSTQSNLKAVPGSQVTEVLEAVFSEHLLEAGHCNGRQGRR